MDKSNKFSTLRKYLKRVKEEEREIELETERMFQTSVNVTLTEKILAYSIVIMVFSFIAFLLFL